MADRVTQITDKYYLFRDPYQMWISVKMKSKKEDDYYRRVTGYHTTYESLLRGFIDAKLKGVEAKNAERILANIKSAANEVKKLAGELGRELDRRDR